MCKRPPGRSPRWHSTRAACLPSASRWCRRRDITTLSQLSSPSGSSAANPCFHSTAARPGDRQRLGVAVDADHLGRRRRRGEHDREGAGAGSHVGDASAVGQPGRDVLSESVAEQTLAHRHPDDQVIEAGQAAQSGGGDVAVAFAHRAVPAGSPIVCRSSCVSPTTQASSITPPVNRRRCGVVLSAARSSTPAGSRRTRSTRSRSDRRPNARSHLLRGGCRRACRRG